VAPLAVERRGPGSAGESGEVILDQARPSRRVGFAQPRTPWFGAVSVPGAGKGATKFSGELAVGHSLTGHLVFRIMNS
jgi:hypothetical protein